MLICTLFYVLALKEKTRIFQGGKNTQRLYNFSITKVPGVVQNVFTIYGFINGTIIYTHVCMYIGMYLSFVYPNLHSHKQMLPLLDQGSNVQAEKCLIIIKLYREGKVK